MRLRSTLRRSVRFSSPTVLCPVAFLLDTFRFGTAFRVVLSPAGVECFQRCRRLHSEMALGKGTLFYSFDYSMNYESGTSPLLALEWDVSLRYRCL